jgi:hypothetical protein
MLENFFPPDPRLIPTEEIGNDVYQKVVLREDQIELIADAVVRKLEARDA